MKQRTAHVSVRTIIHRKSRCNSDDSEVVTKTELALQDAYLHTVGALLVLFPNSLGKALIPRLFNGFGPASHVTPGQPEPARSGGKGRVRTGVRMHPVLCLCKLGQDIPCQHYVPLLHRGAVAVERGSAPKKLDCSYGQNRCGDSAGQFERGPQLESIFSMAMRLQRCPVSICI